MNAVTLIKTPAETGLANLFAMAKAELPGDASAREEAFSIFSERGLPHRRVEEFKYTDLRAAMREAPPLATAIDGSAIPEHPVLGALDAFRVTVANGRFAPEASRLDGLPEGATVVSLAEALTGHPLLTRMNPVEATRGNPVYQLNAALMTDGAVIRVAAGTKLDRPLYLRFVVAAEAPVATVTRVLLVVEEGASVTLIESHEGPAGLAYQTNGVVEVVAGDRAQVQHLRLLQDGAQGIALSTLAAKLGAHASFRTLNLVAGAALSRHQVYVTFAGDHATAQIDGAAMLSGTQHADSTLVVEHAAPYGVSRELFKTVIDDEATGVFQGKIIVHPKAQKTDGRMMSAALLLSEGGAMNNKPELEIFADDVQCAHGATCGQLDEDLLFYLMARGLPRKEAESLMVQAFLGEAIEGVEHEGAREALLGVVEGWLRARAA